MAQNALGSVRAITFDMYGTLLDLEASFIQGFKQFLKSKGSTQEAADVIRIWEADYLRESMAETLSGLSRTPFEQLRRTSLSHVFTQLGVAHNLDDIESLLTSKAQVSLFPDVQEGLLALRGRYTLAVLSNGDLDPLQRAVTGLSIPVEKVISAEQAGVYKPHPAVYAAAVEQLGLPKDRVLHVAAHPWDIRGAKAFGLLGAYINRDSAPYGDSPIQADLEVAQLTDLAGCLS